MTGTNIDLTDPKQRACVALALDPNYKPRTNIRAILKKAGVLNVYGYLRNSPDPICQKVVTIYDSLSKVERAAVTIDHIIAAAKVDPAELIGKVTAEVFRVEGAAANMIAAVHARRVLKKRIDIASDPTQDGHQDAKMILQIAGVAPVPKNQVTNIAISKSQIETHNTQVNVPSLADVVKTVDKVIPKIIEAE